MGLDLLFKLLLMCIEVSLFYKDMDHNQLPVLFTPERVRILRKERKKTPQGLSTILYWSGGQGMAGQRKT